MNSYLFEDSKEYVLKRRKTEDFVKLEVSIL